MRAPTAGGPGAEVTQAGELRSARIESLRAIAALGVLVGHEFVVARGLRFDSYLDRVILGGGFGVDLFFALTGYLLFWPFARRLFGDGPRVDLRRYTLNRGNAGGPGRRLRDLPAGRGAVPAPAQALGGSTGPDHGRASAWVAGRIPPDGSRGVPGGPGLSTTRSCVNTVWVAVESGHADPSTAMRTRTMRAPPGRPLRRHALDRAHAARAHENLLVGMGDRRRADDVGAQRVGLVAPAAAREPERSHRRRRA